MKLISFNVNGVRARIFHILKIIEIYKPDVIGLQETKVENKFFPRKEFENLGYFVYCNGQKKHYGVAFLTKIKPKKVQIEFSNIIENQCRIITSVFYTKLGKLNIINIYSPQGENKTHPKKFFDKKNFFYSLKNYLKNNFFSHDYLILMGDINISPKDLDIGIGEKNKKIWLKKGKCSFLVEERIWFNRLLKWGLIDIWREKNPNVNNIFSWFDYRSKGFIKNCGLRIDMFLITKNLLNFFRNTDIIYSIRNMKRPSDHAPILLDLNI